MTGNRVRIGFHRVGVAFAILPTLAALGALGIGAFQWGSPVVKPPTFELQHTATGKTIQFTYGSNLKLIGKNLKAAFAPLAVPDNILEGVDKTIADVDRSRQEGLWVIAVVAPALLAFAAAAYAVSWLIGWIVRGFLGEGSS
jgi:hypothetical protein